MLTPFEIIISGSIMLGANLFAGLACDWLRARLTKPETN